MDFEDGLGFVVIGLLLGALIFGGGSAACAAGNTEGRGEVRSEAINANAAHYEVNEKTGSTRFVWGPAKDQPK